MFQTKCLSGSDQQQPFQWHNGAENPTIIPTSHSDWPSVWRCEHEAGLLSHASFLKILHATSFHDFMFVKH